MDKEEAAALLGDHLRAYRRRPYAELVALLGEIEVAEVEGPSGSEYQIEIQFFWDGRPGGDVRVLGLIDDGSFRAAFSPRSDSFIVAPDGTFVGE